MDKLEINIGIFGCVSVGKSTFLNAITGCQYSDVEIKKTTMIPQVYLESDNPDEPHDPESIRQINREANKAVMKAIELNTFNRNQCKPIYHNIDRICDLLDPEVIDPNIKINIYDTPGLNDSASKDIYFEWVKQNIKLFDIIIFMTDITKGLNNSDEYEVLNLLMDSVCKHNTKMVCLMNKCDDIYYDEEQNDLVFEEEEQENIYIQANDILLDIAKSHGLEPNNKNLTPFLPISSENCFIYRAIWNDANCKLDPAHLNRLCKNECGTNQWKKMSHEEKEIVFYTIVNNLQSTYPDSRGASWNGSGNSSSYKNKISDTGYLTAKLILQNIIVSNMEEFELKHLENHMDNLKILTSENINEYIKLVEQYVEKLEKNRVLNSSSYDNLWNTIAMAINSYISVPQVTNRICNKNKCYGSFDYFDSFNFNNSLPYINFEQFETFHGAMELYSINLSLLMNSFQNIKAYPQDFFIMQQSKIMKNLLCIYDKFSASDPIFHVHIRPSNLHHYLQIINLYSPKEFGKYSEKFLKLMVDPKCKYVITDTSELISMVEYIAEKCSIDDVNMHLSTICTIFIHKQQYIQSKFPKHYFQYLIGLKKILWDIIKSLNPQQLYTPLDILYESINKNILIYLEPSTVSTVSNFYKSEANNQKVLLLLNDFSDKINSAIELDLEQKLLNAFVPKMGFQKNSP